MNRRVVITGLGVVSSLGHDIRTFWSHLVGGACAIQPISTIPTEGLKVKVAAEITNFNPDDFPVDRNMMRRADRYSQFAMVAATQAMQDSGLEIAPERLDVYVGSGTGGIQTFHTEHTKLVEKGASQISPLFVPMMISNIAAGNIAILFHAEGPCLPIVTACATGTHSIGEAFRTIRHGYADAIIAGGAEAAITPIAVAGFANSRALSLAENPAEASLPFDKRRQGFVIGEGAGIVVLEEYEHAKKRNAHIYAEVCGFGNTCDAHHYTAPRPDGKSATIAITQALKEAGYTENERLYVNAHGTGTPLNDKTETLAIKQALGEDAARRAMISSNKSMLGHCLGAAGGLEVVATALSLTEGVLPPTIHLQEPDPECDLDYIPNEARREKADIAISNSFGFGGQNACVTLRPIR
ncbi:MAG: beta-ketoacyl-ACP synthase II [Bacteroidales bacterium]|nr:beta-ketoacyl-ACP synthase II [Bacteroidales bacterium]